MPYQEWQRERPGEATATCLMRKLFTRCQIRRHCPAQTFFVELWLPGDESAKLKRVSVRCSDRVHRILFFFCKGMERIKYEQ